MESAKYTPEIQIRMIALLLQKEVDATTGRFLAPTLQKGVRLFKHLHKVDDETFASTFSFAGIAPVLAVLGEYYARYADLPGREVYEGIKGKNLKYQRWTNDAREGDQRKLRALEAELFTPHPDEAYTQAQLVDFITRSFLVQTARQTSDYLINGAKSPGEIAAWTVELHRQFLADLQDDIDGTAGGKFLIGGRHKVKDSRDVEALPTLFQSVRLYLQGITVLVAPPKSFKTGISQNIALDLLKRGVDVMFVDLENGELKMMRRWWQALLNCPKEWLYADTYIDRVTLEEVTGIPTHIPDKHYRAGERVWRHGAEEVDGEWRINSAVWEALRDAAETIEDWEELDMELPEEVLYSAQEALETVLEEIGKASEGEILLESLRGATVADIRRRVERAVNSTTSKFFHGARPRVLIIDWGQKLKNKNPKLNYWEKKRDNYEQLQELCDLYNLHLLIIEAPKEYAKLADPHFNPANLITAGTDQIAFDAVSMAAVMATADEQAAGFRRLQLVVDRDSGNLKDYIRVDYETFRAWGVTPEEHRGANPRLWQEWEAGVRPDAGRKGKPDIGARIADFQMRGVVSGDVEDR